MRVVLTHPQPRIQGLARTLRERGHEVLELPLRRLVPQGDHPAVRALLDNAWTFDWVIFVSPGAVDSAWPVMPPVWPPETGVATIGPGTEAALAARGFDFGLLARAPVRPTRPPYDAGALLQEPPFDAPGGMRLLVVRGETGRDDWIDTLVARGALVERVAVHRSEPLTPSSAGLEQAGLWLRQAGVIPLAFVFTTLDAIDTLAGSLPKVGRAHAHALSVHPKLSAALHKCGWAQAREIDPGESGLVAGIESAIRS